MGDLLDQSEFDSRPESEDRDDYSPLTDRERMLLVMNLVKSGLPPREVVPYVGCSHRTVARIINCQGVKREKLKFYSPIKDPRRIRKVLTDFFAIEGHSLTSLNALAIKHSTTLQRLIELIRTHARKSGWDARPCLGPCGSLTVTPSPKDRYCPECSRQMKKVKKAIDATAIL
jgi:hypothetical protein